MFFFFTVENGNGFFKLFQVQVLPNVFQHRMTSAIQSVNIATGPCHAHACVLIRLVFLFQYTVMLYTEPYLGA